MAKTINTRLQMKYDSLANWQTNNPTLLVGEIACVSIGEITTDNKGNRVIPPVMMKVGPGAFNDLGWIAAKAADVYAWAKKENLELTDLPDIPVQDDGTGKFVTDVSWDNENNKIVITRADAVNSIAADNNSLYFDKSTGDVKAKVKISEAEGNILSLGADGIYVPSPEEVSFPGADNEDSGSEDIEGTVAVVSNGTFWYNDGSGKYTLSEEYVNVPTKEYVDNIDTGVHEVTLTSGTNNGTLKLTVDGASTDNIAVKGLGSAAYTDTNAYATADQGAKGVEALNKINAFMSDEAQVAGAIDTLVEINKYITEDTAAFTALSGRVTTTEEKVSALEDLVGENGKVENAENADVAAGYTEGGAIDTAIKAAANAGTTAASNVQTGIENGTIKAGEAKKVSNSLTITGDGVTETTFDGSAAKTVTIDLSGYQEKGNYQPAGNYKTVQEAVAAKGDATKLLTVSQDTNGVVSLTEHELSIKNVKEATDHATVTEEKDYIIFNCGSSSINV